MTKDPQTKYAIKNSKITALVREFSGWTPRELVRYIDELRRENEALEAELEAYKAEMARKNQYVELPVYKKTWNLSNKLHYELLRKQKPMTLPDFQKALLERDKNALYYEDPKTMLATYLNRLSKNGRFIRLKIPGLNTYYYILPEWQDSNGKLLVEFKLTDSYFR